MTSAIALAKRFSSMAVKKSGAVARAIQKKFQKISRSMSSESKKRTFVTTGTIEKTNSDLSEEALWTFATKSLPMMQWDLRPTAGPLVKMRGKEVLLLFPEMQIPWKVVRNEVGAWEASGNFYLSREMAKALDTLYDKYMASMVVM